MSSAPAKRRWPGTPHHTVSGSMDGLGGGEPHKLGFPKLLMEEMQGWRGVIDGVHRVSMASIPHTREGLTVDRDNMAQVAQIHRNRLDSFILG